MAISTRSDLGVEAQPPRPLSVGLVPDVEMSASPVSVSPATRPYSAAWPTMSKASGAFGSADDIRASPELCEKVCGLVVTANPPYCLAALPVIARCMLAEVVSGWLESARQASGRDRDVDPIGAFGERGEGRMHPVLRILGSELNQSSAGPAPELAEYLRGLVMGALDPAVDVEDLAQVPRPRMHIAFGPTVHSLTNNPGKQLRPVTMAAFEPNGPMPRPGSVWAIESQGSDGWVHLSVRLVDARMPRAIHSGRG